MCLTDAFILQTASLCCLMLHLSGEWHHKLSYIRRMHRQALMNQEFIFKILGASWTSVNGHFKDNELKLEVIVARSHSQLI